jgi:hypothetical protein
MAAISAVMIGVMVYMPAEYGTDPTGVGSILGLTQMGEIKTQLAEEAEADRLLDLENNRLLELENSGATDDQSSVGGRIFGFFFSAAYAQTATAEWIDQYSVTLTPGEGVEVKLVMEEGAEAEFKWVAEGGVINFDLHGDGGGQNISYEKGRALAEHEGVLKAAFTGNHGWFWRNRDRQDVTVTLFVRGDYSEMKLP